VEWGTRREAGSGGLHEGDKNGIIDVEDGVYSSDHYMRIGKSIDGVKNVGNNRHVSRPAHFGDESPLATD
jgi:hypothetical protein